MKVADSDRLGVARDRYPPSGQLAGCSAPRSELAFRIVDSTTVDMTTADGTPADAATAAPGRLSRWGDADLVDCDVHVTVASVQALVPYLDPRWRDYLSESGVRGIDPPLYP